MTKEQALNKLAQLCSRKEQSEWAVRKKLMTWEIPTEETNEIIEKLYGLNFLNMERYALSYVNDKSKFNKWGPDKIRMLLKQQRIDEHIIQKALCSIKHEDEFETCKTILSTKLRFINEKDVHKLRTKLIRFGLGRGFKMEIVLKAISSFNIQVEDED